MEINELLLKGGGVKLYMKKRPSIFGTIKLVDDIYEINYWYKSIFQNTYHEDGLEQAKKRLRDLLTNAYIQLDENREIKKFNNYITEEIKSYNVFDINNYNTVYKVDYRSAYSEILNDFETWCKDNNITPTEEIIQSLFDYTLDDCILYGSDLETNEIYDNGEYEYEEFYYNFLAEEYPQISKAKKFNL